MFYAVPEPVMVAVTKHLISDFAFVLYARLMGFWSAEKPVFASNKELGVWVGKSARQIVQALAELGEAGLIKREMKGRVRYIYPVFTGVGERQEPRRGKPRLRSAENRAPGARKTALEERGKPRSTNIEVTNKELLPPTPQTAAQPALAAQPAPAPQRDGEISQVMALTGRSREVCSRAVESAVSHRAGDVVAYATRVAQTAPEAAPVADSSHDRAKADAKAVLDHMERYKAVFDAQDPVGRQAAIASVWAKMGGKPAYLQ